MTDEKSHSEKEERFAAFLRSKGLRLTFERKAILHKALQHKRHFDVETLSRELGEDGQRVSVATLYSAMRLLVECGIARELRLDRRGSHFEIISVSAGHVHLICSHCGKVKAVRDDDLMKTINSKSYPAFTGESFSLYYYGMCNACARKLKKVAKDDNGTGNAK
ncbi:MAG: transcriptional repressor [Muribaculaceae bacterium]|mgnify:FL=1|nr:transcriptional repressor [Muribaculaceae bacterium]